MISLVITIITSIFYVLCSIALLVTLQEVHPEYEKSFLILEAILWPIIILIQLRKNNNER